MPTVILDKIKKMWMKLRDLAKDLPRDELLVLMAAASIFLPFIITGLTFLCVSIHAITDKSSFAKILQVKDKRILIILAALVMIVPLFRSRWISLAASLCFVILIIFFLFLQSVMTVKLYTFAFKICCAMSVWSFIYAAIQKITHGSRYRSTAGMLNANYYATVIEFVVLICVYLILTENTHCKLYLAVIAINIAGLFLCDCQSSWLPIIAGILVLLFLNGYKKYAIAFLIISIFTMLTFITVPGILPRLDRLPQTFHTRLNIWKTAVKGIREFPFLGNGSMGYLYIYEKFGGYKTYHAHSLYLEPLLSYGFIGTGVIISYIINKVRRLRKLTFVTNDRPIKSVMLAVAAATMIHGFTDYAIFWVQTGMLACLIMSAIGIKSSKKVLER